MKSLIPRNPKDKFNSNSELGHAKEWNPEDWQGRNKSQVEGAYKINATIMLILAVTVVLISILA